MNGSTDQQWLRDFARSGEEEPFRKLVEAHSGMVFGTALRLVREAPAAQEVTQNVFVALARKAPFLPRDISVGAWLHRSAVLEAKNWVRGEVRRKQREESAGGEMMTQEESLLESLKPVLDEALLDLREQDRAALLLRYLQQRSLKEVGEMLGVSEDTAQKRVAKAVESLTGAFRKRGYTVPAAAMTIAALESAACLAPAALGQAVLATAFAAAPVSLGGAALLAAKFMSLTKAQTATVCLLLASAPVGVQWQRQREARAEQAPWLQALQLNASRQQELENRAQILRREISLAHTDLLARQAELHRASTAPEPLLPPPEQLYAWSPQSPFVRLPKSALNDLKLTPRREFYEPGATTPRIGRGEVLSDDGEISPVLLEALGLDSNQSAEVQRAFLNFSAEFQAVARTRTYLTNSMPPGVSFHLGEGSSLVTLHTPSFPEEGERLRDELRDRLRTAIGPDRTDILLEKQAGSDLRGSFLDFAKAEKWIAAARQENGMYRFAKSTVLDGASIGASVTMLKYDQLPDELKQHLPPPAKKDL